MTVSPRFGLPDLLTWPGTGVRYGRFQSSKGGDMAIAYCLKCRKKVEIKDPRETTLRNRKPAVAGSCPVCGKKVFRIGKL